MESCGVSRSPAESRGVLRSLAEFRGVSRNSRKLKYRESCGVSRSLQHITETPESRGITGISGASRSLPDTTGTHAEYMMVSPPSSKLFNSGKDDDLFKIGHHGPMGIGPV